MKERSVVVIKQLIKSLEEALPKLEEAYKNNDFIKFTNSKKFIFQIQEKIDERLR